MIAQFFALPIYLFLLFVLMFGLLTLSLKSAFASCLTSSLFSISCAVLYFFLQSPDVAMTEASIGVFLSTAFFLMTARIIKTEIFVRPSKAKLAACLLCFVVLVFVLYSSVLTLGSFGNIESARGGSGDLHLLLSYQKYHIPNVVTTVLASFRGFDTMGETIIILTSALGVFLVLKLKNSKFHSI